MIKSKFSTTVKGQDKVDKLMKVLKAYSNAYVTVGIHEDAGMYSKGEASVVEVALWNEFGTQSVPERSWMRSTMDEIAPQLNRMRDQMIDNILGKGWSVEKALGFMGFFIQNKLQNKIKSNVGPAYGTGKKPNSADEIGVLQEYKREKFGHANTLRASELMLRSVTFKVVLE